MNETLLWLLYCVSAALSFGAIYYRRWQPMWAILSGGLITMIGWLLIFRFSDEDKRPDWLKLDLSLNLTFGLIFACFGAALAWWLLRRREDAE